MVQEHTNVASICCMQLFATLWLVKYLRKIWMCITDHKKKSTLQWPVIIFTVFVMIMKPIWSCREFLSPIWYQIWYQTRKIDDDWYPCLKFDAFWKVAKWTKACSIKIPCVTNLWPTLSARALIASCEFTVWVPILYEFQLTE